MWIRLDSRDLHQSHTEPCSEEGGTTVSSNTFLDLITMIRTVVFNFFFDRKLIFKITNLCFKNIKLFVDYITKYIFNNHKNKIQKTE